MRAHLPVSTRLLAACVLSLAACLAAFGAADQNQGWIEVRSPHFVVSSNASEREARRIADQFEQIRALFHTAFPHLRVNPAQPVLILAAKNENTMKMLLPEDWEAKGHVHPAGLYQEGEDKHYVLLQMDSSGDHPFHALYHEYTHALLHLNFASLPLWLDEGLAEFYGNSRLGEKESQVGTIDREHLYILREHKLLPIETLLTVEHNSSYYNEADPASVFYAESWAVVHYLMLDPEAQKQELLKKFVAAWEQGGTQIEAAQKAFGDLKQFGRVIEGYARQSALNIAVFKNGQQSAEKTYPARSLSAGEVLALRGDAATHRDMLEQAGPLVEQAVKLEPNLAISHEALGYYFYRKGESSRADLEMKKAMELGSSSFVAPYYHGQLMLNGGLAETAELREAIESFERATKLNPQFAPAFEGLAHAYSESRETQKQALDAGITAVKLEPAVRAYGVNLVYLLLNAERTAEARRLAQRLVETAASPEEAESGRELLARIAEHEKFAAQSKLRAEEAAKAAAASPAPATASSANASATTTPVSAAHAIDPATLMAADGLVRKADCSQKPAITVTLSGGNRPLIFHAADFAAVEVSGTNSNTLDLSSCEAWKGRRVRIWFVRAKGKPYLGEITDIAFE